MASANGGAASALLGPLFDGDRVDLVEVARTRFSLHYEIPPHRGSARLPTGAEELSTVSVCTPAAVRLPNSLVADRLPGGGGATIGAGVLATSTGTWRVTRWWAPPRPRGLRPPRAGIRELRPDKSLLRLWRVPEMRPSYDGLLPVELLGCGPGLTPAGDDVLAGFLVAAHATADPRLAGWQDAVRDRLLRVRTTAVSLAMLECALDGYATTELSDYLYAVCDDGPAGSRKRLHRATAGLQAVGHSSGAALMAGVQLALSTRLVRGAA